MTAIVKFLLAGAGALSVAGQAQPEHPSNSSTTASTVPVAAAGGPEQRAAASADGVLDAAVQLSAAVQRAGAESAAAYAQAEALEFAYLAQAAFCPRIAQAWDCGPCEHVPGVDSVRTANDPDLSAHSYVAKHDGQCTIAFRGTDATRAWIQDLKSLALVDLPGCTFEGRTCQVGEGFLQDYVSLAPQIKAELNSIGCSKENSLAITGHSLGGALAMLALFDLAGLGYTVSKAYTFGSPRVGDAAFAGAFGKLLGSVPIFRVTKSDDPVPMVPADPPFEHVGQEIYYQGGQAPKVCAGNEDFSCSHSQEDNLFWLTLRCAFGNRACGHMTYFPAQMPFLMHCDASESIFFP